MRAEQWEAADLELQAVRKRAAALLSELRLQPELAKAFLEQAEDREREAARLRQMRFA